MRGLVITLQILSVFGARAVCSPESHAQKDSSLEKLLESGVIAEPHRDVDTGRQYSPLSPSVAGLAMAGLTGVAAIALLVPFVFSALGVGGQRSSSQQRRIQQHPWTEEFADFEEGVWGRSEDVDANAKTTWKSLRERGRKMEN